MTIQRYRKHSNPGAKYVAWQVAGPMEPIPDWLNGLVAKGEARDDDHGLSVKTITGDWRRTTQGTWIVYQQNGWLWEIAHADFQRMFYEVA